MSIRRNVGLNFVLWGLGTAILVPPAIFAIRLFQWLKSGEWVPWTIADLLFATNNQIPAVDWVGLQKITDWLVFCEIEWVILFSGLAVSGLGHLIMGKES